MGGHHVSIPPTCVEMSLLVVIAEYAELQEWSRLMLANSWRPDGEQWALCVCMVRWLAGCLSIKPTESKIKGKTFTTSVLKFHHL